MKFLLNKDIKSKAELFRTSNGFGPADSICLYSFLLKKNITTLFKPMSGDFAGMAIRVNNERNFILINCNHNKGKQHFTIAHELYHLYIQDNFKTHKCTTGIFDKQSDNEEIKADIFAACFLMPENGVIELIPDKEKKRKNLISTETLFRIQHYYGVSFNALLYRLIELGYIEKSYYDRYEFGKKAIASRLGYDIGLYEPANENKVISDYASKASFLYHNRIITEAEYLRLLNTIGIDPFSEYNRQ